MDEKKPANHKITLINLLMLILGLTIIVALFLLFDISFQDTIEQFLQADLNYVLPFTVLSLLQMHVISARWRIILSQYVDVEQFKKGYIFLNISISILMMSLFSLVGYVGTKSVTMKMQYNIPAMKTACAVIIELFVGLLSMFFMMLPSFFYTLNIFSLEVTLMANVLAIVILYFGFFHFYKYLITLIIVPVFQLLRWMSAIRAIGKRFDPKVWNPETFSEIHNHAAGKIFLYTLAGYYIILIKCYILFLALGITDSWLVFYLYFPFGYFIASLGLTPGGLGITEVGWFGVLIIAGVSDIQAAVFVLTHRIWNQATFLLIPLLAYALYKWHNMTSIPRRSAT